MFPKWYFLCTGCSFYFTCVGIVWNQKSPPPGHHKRPFHPSSSMNWSQWQQNDQCCSMEVGSTRGPRCQCLLYTLLNLYQARTPGHRLWCGAGSQGHYARWSMDTRLMVHHRWLSGRNEGAAATSTPPQLKITYKGCMPAMTAPAVASNRVNNRTDHPRTTYIRWWIVSCFISDEIQYYYWSLNTLFWSGPEM